jgi:hypothetical protein
MALSNDRVLALETRQALTFVPSGTTFFYCPRKLRQAARATLLASGPAFACIFAGNIWVRCAALCYLLAIVCLCDALQTRAQARRCALVVNAWGITYLPQSLQIRWQDVARIHEVHTRAAKAIDIELRWPETFSAHASRAVRFGTWCQRYLHLPAVTLSLWLLDASAATVLAAVATHRPDLLHANNKVASDP